MNISILNRPPRHVVEPFAEPRPGDAGEATGFGAQVKERLWQGMARECEAMVKHAFSTGRVVPVEVMECLDRAVSAPDGLMAFATSDRSGDASRADTEPRSAPEIVISRLALLTAAHSGLAFAIAPATPEAVRLMADEYERHPTWCEFGPLPLVRQMLGLAMALMHDPEILLIDELSLGLAPVMVESLLTVVDRLKVEGQTMIIVEQSLNVALEIAERAVFMEKGRIRFEGPSQELLERDDLVRAVFLGIEGT